MAVIYIFQNILFNYKKALKFILEQFWYFLFCKVSFCWYCLNGYWWEEKKETIYIFSLLFDRERQSISSHVVVNWWLCLHMKCSLIFWNTEWVIELFRSDSEYCFALKIRNKTIGINFLKVIDRTNSGHEGVPLPKNFFTLILLFVKYKGSKCRK